MKLPAFVKSPGFLIGGLAAVAWFILPRDKFPVGSKWKYGSTGETWTVYAVRDDGNTILFSTSSGQMTAPLFKTQVEEYVRQSFLVPA
jgi:hypothetical protein